ncbi:hypothetical protein JTE90_027269 [Oedothorax gibbosus]|uniref:Insulin receptor substrate 1 n=1 Tax=Oedothorax gibbosus TaxID=931172 RepID=A0AAV6W273_9ARAC|nr:hypothetical protein JTE90_027269 [Oedothorax gibbosus]
MSQKYKSFSRGNGRNSACGSSLPPGVKRMGYLRKFKKMKRRFFVLHMESNYGVARLEYYSSEKKWKFGGEPRRCIELKSCLNISRKLHSKHKNVIALYTQDDCFSVVADSSEDMELWLNDLLEVQRNFMEVDENARGRPIYQHLWQVVIDKHDLEDDRLSLGPYRVALSSKSLFLIKMNSLDENDCFEFLLMSIRRCGHSKDHFFIELGRSSVIGAGEIYMATEGTIIAQNMHETVLSAMKSSKIREDGNPPPRPRSASTSENSNAAATRRPVAPPSSISSCGLSSSRERCDSLPNRPQSVSGNSHSCVLSALSSPYTSSGTTFRNMSSRPHSMYEWPSFNSNTGRNASFSPSSLSSTTGYSSSTEEIDKIKSQSLSFSNSQSIDNKKSLECCIPELSDEYLRMSVTGASGRKDLHNRNPNEVVTRIPDYMDMKSTANSVAEPVPKSRNIEPHPQNSISSSVQINNGYFDLSPRNTLPKAAHHSHSLYREVDNNLLSKGFKDQKKFDVGQHAICSRSIAVKKDEICKSPTTSALNSNCSMKIASEKENTSLNNKAIYGMKPPLPGRTNLKTENKSNVCPPLPTRRGELAVQGKDQSKALQLCTASKDTELQNQQVLSLDLSNKNSELEDQDVFYNTTNSVKYKNVVSPGQNTNFSCLHSAERSNTHSFPCAQICSATKSSSSYKTIFHKTEQNEVKPRSQHQNSTNKFLSAKNACDKVEIRLPIDSKVSAFSKSKPNAETTALSDQNSNRPPLAENASVGEYVNVDIKSNSPPMNQTKLGYPTPKHNPQILPPCPDDDSPSYSNLQFGKPFCPSPKPILATGHPSPKTEWPFLFPNYPEPGEVPRCPVPKTSIMAPMFRNIPNTLPAFRKQMSAPAAPPSLRPELVSPGRKSSCPVTASASMIRPSQPGTSTCSMHQEMRTNPVFPAPHGIPSVLLKVSAATKSPDHSSVSSISSASDEISSAHSSPKTNSLNFRQQPSSDCQYENVVIPQRSAMSSRPASTSSEEKELNYALLDLAPSEDAPRSPSIAKPVAPENEETLTYAQIDFAKSEGLKNISGSVREGRL